MLKRTLILVLCFAAISGEAQSRKRNFRQRELGFFGGGSYYIGDINTRRHFMATHPAAGVFFRYSTNYRYAFRFGLSYGTISGNDAASGEPDQIERNLNFKSDIYELNAIAEFNFVEYRIGHDRFRFTFFIFGGLGGFMHNPTSNTGHGNQELINMNNEGSSYSKYQVCVPFGVGTKWTIAEKVGMGIEWGPRRTFTDFLDDVSGTYPENSSSTGVEGTPNATSEPGNMRGNPRTRDWYFYFGVTLSFALPDPHRQCHTGD